MAEPDDQTPPAERSEKWDEIGALLFKGFTRGWGTLAGDKAFVAYGQQSLGAVVAMALKLISPVGLGFAKGIAEAEDQLAPEFAKYAAAAVSDVFGVNVPASAFAQAHGGGGREQGGAPLGAGLLDMMRGQGTQLQPSEAPAARYVSIAAGMALEDWFKGWFFEVLSSLVPQIDIGKIENYGALGDKVANVLGLSGVSRRVFRPLVDSTIVTPMEWATNKTYRPRLLSPSDCARQILREPETAETWLEELRRHGYREDQIDVLRNNQRRFFSPGDVRDFVYRGHWDHGRGLQHLRDQGYDEDAATDALRLEGLRRIAALEQQEANAIITAFVDRAIDEGTFRMALSSAVSVPAERALLTELAEVRRAVNVKRLSLAQVEAMVKSGVLQMRDYVRAAEREGYPPEDVDALELQLEWERDKAKTIAELKAAREAARQKAREDAAAARAKRLAEVEARRALARRGTEGDLERAAIRGLIPFARVGELYAAKYDQDTAAILLAELEDRRLEYLDRLRRRDEAAKRAAIRDVDVGRLEAAVIAGVLTVSEFRDRLEGLKFTGEDAELLTRTLKDRLADLAEAKRLRELAAAAAKVRRVSLSTVETLVRRGHRTMDWYDRTLAELGFDEAARAAMRDLLQDTIDRDAAARAEREAAALRLRAKGVSVDQFRRAVLAGVRTIDQFQSFLVANDFTADAQMLLVDTLREDVAEANAARQRRQAADAGVERRSLSIARVARAVRLGIASITEYEARLAAAGYTPEDIALDVDLLVEEMKLDADAKRLRAATAADAATKDPTLGQLEDAVRAGLRSLAEYAERLTGLGYRPDDVALLVALLELELAGARDRVEE